MNIFRFRSHCVYTHRWCLPFLLLILSSCAFVSAQVSQIDHVINKLERYANDYPQERVYLHLDKPYYAVGDDIWLKGYVTIGAYNYLSGFSKILYVDLIDFEDKIVRSIRLPLMDGMAIGDVHLADSLREGNYRLRAYTNWMRNFGSDFFYDRTFPVGRARADSILTDSLLSFESSQRRRLGSPGAELKPIEATSNINRIQFFAESGHLVAGNLAKVSFKALTPGGVGVAVQGYVEDENGSQVAAFESSHGGMGNFSFVPEQKIQYIAKLTYADSSYTEVKLPEVHSTGYTLAVNNDLDKQIFVQAFATDDLVRGQETFLLLHKDGTVFYAFKSKFVTNELVFAIPRDHLPAGVLQLTLFSPDMKPLCERKIFNIDASALLPLSITTSGKTFGSFQKVAVQITAGHHADTSRIATLSAAIVDMTKMPIDSGVRDGNILADLLLKSGIRGYIEMPEYYFEGTDVNRRRQLDNVMLTQGWSQIKWQDLQMGRTPAIAYTPERDLRISGVVTKRDGKTPVPGASVTLLSPGNISAVIDTLSDAGGRFNFDRLVFYDDTRFVIQARDDRGRKNVEVILDELPRHQVTPNPNTPDAIVDVNRSMGTYLQNAKRQFAELERSGLREKSIVLDEVEVTEHTLKNKVARSSNLNGAGNADQVLTAEDFSMGCSTLELCLQAMLRGVIFRNGVPYSTRSLNQPMQVIIDGIFMEGNAISMINPSDVESVEVLRSIGNTAIYGSGGGSGVLIITSKLGNGRDSRKDLYTPSIVTHSAQGYYAVREFYAPDYNSDSVDSRLSMADLRTTIHWAANIITNEEGVASIEFYTAESPGIYRIVVEGLDVNGRLGRAVHYIIVE